MNPYANTPIGQLVIDRPSRARVFERRAIDYCCGGKATLAAVCSERSLPLAEILAELDEVDRSSEPEGSNLPHEPVELIQRILDTHHAYLKTEFPRVSALAEKVRDAHGTRHPELHAIASTYERLRADLEPHLMKEEQVLFPWVRELARGGGAAPGRPSVQAPIGMMEIEHEEAGALLAKLRELSNGFEVPPDGCPTFHTFYAALAELERDTHQHIHTENNLLFPMALALER